MATTSKRTWGILLGAVLASITSVSAHVVRGLVAPQSASAFVSSPAAGTDLPARLVWGAVDTGLRVVCFSVANTSPSQADRPGWPRVIGAGLELPGTLSGFSLVAPTDDNWELVEGVAVPLPGRGHVVLDFAVVTRVNPVGRKPGRPHDPSGIPPGQAAVRGTGTRFCVAGPFPDRLTAAQDTTIEQLLNGVVVGFVGVEGHGPSMDVGIWTDPQRVVPLYP